MELTRVRGRGRCPGPCLWRVTLQPWCLGVGRVLIRMMFKARARMGAFPGEQRLCISPGGGWDLLLESPESIFTWLLGSLGPGNLLRCCD